MSSQRQNFESLLERVSGVLEAGGSEVQRETPPLPEGAFKKGGCFQKTSRKRLLEKSGFRRTVYGNTAGNPTSGSRTG